MPDQHQQPDRAPSIPDVLRRRRDVEQARVVRGAVNMAAVESYVSGMSTPWERARFRMRMAGHDLDRLVVTPVRWRLLRLLPRAVVYWVTIHAVASVTGRGREVVDQVPAMEVIGRWGTGRERAAAEQRRRAREAR